ncbi:hypothetical protein PLESTB_001669900 [Pleodorina starrii]|uniref:RNA exonuclease 4 n=1 Tax=Pleodorina starrii TaxID=330485 RepID=A0A9W6F9J2_9CHLO|nr:hypothetical protein PLESTM_000624700 [Pleodorina starrii]GLC60780.1 hypothetical protein PLESTB_001669900 [Pleodorina starrii]GLC75499.1 hypothetical protein PLESTF_001644300 [Pleodorina starrii]
MAKKGRNGSGGEGSGDKRPNGRLAEAPPAAAAAAAAGKAKAKGTKRLPAEPAAAANGPVANGSGAKRQKVRHEPNGNSVAAAAAAAQYGDGPFRGNAASDADGAPRTTADASKTNNRKAEKQKEQQQQQREKGGDVATASAAAASGDADGGGGAAAAAAATKPVGRRLANSNWEALKPAVAASKRPPPPEHVIKARARKAAAAVAAAGGGAAATAAAAGGRRPGLAGSDTGLTKVLAIDCEMVGVGPRGVQSALARVSIVNSSGAVLLDTFVQPNEKVTDYRTWVSGVRPSDLASGAPYDDVVQKVGDMVKGRVLVGHAIGHDLRALRLEEHPRSLLRDTAKYPGLMKELPGGRKVSASLKDLAATHLGLAIQQGEHSPVDDARAALYLYQKHHREWEAAIKSGQLVPVVGGLGGKKKKAADTGAGGSRKGGARGRSGGKGGKDRGAPGVAGGGVRKKEGRTGQLGKGKAKGKEKGKGKAGGGSGPLWSLEKDPYADL